MVSVFGHSRLGHLGLVKEESEKWVLIDLKGFYVTFCSKKTRIHGSATDSWRRRRRRRRRKRAGQMAEQLQPLKQNEQTRNTLHSANVKQEKAHWLSSGLSWGLSIASWELSMWVSGSSVHPNNKSMLVPEAGLPRPRATGVGEVSEAPAWSVFGPLSGEELWGWSWDTRSWVMSWSRWESRFEILRGSWIVTGP